MGVFILFLLLEDSVFYTAFHSLNTACFSFTENIPVWQKSDINLYAPTLRNHILCQKNFVNAHLRLSLVSLVSHLRKMKPPEKHKIKNYKNKEL